VVVPKGLVVAGTLDAEVAAVIQLLGEDTLGSGDPCYIVCHVSEASLVCGLTGQSMIDDVSLLLEGPLNLFDCLDRGLLDLVNLYE